MIGPVNREALRRAFVARLTVDSTTKKRRSKGYNQAIFLPLDEGGAAAWTRTDLAMVMAAFDAAFQDVDMGTEVV